MESLPSELSRNGYGEQSGGKNLWDEVWCVGQIDGNNGNIISSSDQIASVNFIPVKPNTQYKSITTYPFRIAYYDSNKVFKSYVALTQNNEVFTTPSNASYLRFFAKGGYGTTYKHDLAIIEGTSGTYEPYIESNKMLTDDTNEIASLKFLGWTVPREMPLKNYVDGQGNFHQRVGRVRIKDLNWGYGDSGAGFNVFFSSTTIPCKLNTTNIMSASYKPSYSHISAMQDKTVTCSGGSGNVVWIRDSAYTSTSAFISAHGNEYVYYELATEVVMAEGSEVGNFNIVSKQINLQGGTYVTAHVFDKSCKAIIVGGNNNVSVIVDDVWYPNVAIANVHSGSTVLVYSPSDSGAANFHFLTIG